MAGVQTPMQMAMVGTDVMGLVGRPGFHFTDLCSMFWQWAAVSAATAAIVRAAQPGQFLRGLHIPPFRRGSKWYVHPLYDPAAQAYCAAQNVVILQHQDWMFTCIFRPVRAVNVWLHARLHPKRDDYYLIRWRMPGCSSIVRTH